MGRPAAGGWPLGFATDLKPCPRSQRQRAQWLTTGATSLLRTLGVPPPWSGASDLARYRVGSVVGVPPRRAGTRGGLHFVVAHWDAFRIIIHFPVGYGLGNVIPLSSLRHPVNPNGLGNPHSIRELSPRPFCLSLPHTLSLSRLSCRACPSPS